MASRRNQRMPLNWLSVSAMQAPPTGLRIGEQKCVRNCSRWDWKRLSVRSYALLSSLLQRRRSRLHKETSIGRRLPIPVERLMKPPW